MRQAGRQAGRHGSISRPRNLRCKTGTQKTERDGNPLYTGIYMFNKTSITRTTNPTARQKNHTQQAALQSVHYVERPVALSSFQEPREALLSSA